MATPETRSVELDPLAPSLDGDLDAVEREENHILEADTRELSLYSFDSEDKTLVGIGSSGPADPSALPQFDSSDRTLVGIGPAERAKRAHRAQAAELAAELASHSVQAELASHSVQAEAASHSVQAELASHSVQAEAAPESVRMPHSEPPGPFVACDDDEEANPRLPKQRRVPWVRALSAVLVAAAAVALLRGVVPRSTAPRLHSATSVAPLPMANETPTLNAHFETAAAPSAETSVLERPVSRAPDVPQPAPPPASAQRETQSELAAREATSKLDGKEPLGALEVTSNPPASLVLDGRPVGKAPRVIQLPSGPHTVLFVHPERGRMSVTVNVKAGRTTSASANF